MKIWDLGLVWDCKGFFDYENEKSPWKSRTFSGGDGEIWTLAPVTRPTPLAGAPLRPLEYISVYTLASGHLQNSRIILYIIFDRLSRCFWVFLEELLHLFDFYLPITTDFALFPKSLVCDEQKQSPRFGVGTVSVPNRLRGAVGSKHKEGFARCDGRLKALP